MQKLNPIIIRTRKTKKETPDENKQIVLYKPKDRASLPSEKDLGKMFVRRTKQGHFSLQSFLKILLKNLIKIKLNLLFRKRKSTASLFFTANREA